MFLVDDILLSPLRGLLWVFREIHDAAVADKAGEKDQITAQLSELYMELETGRITEAEFDEREKALLDRLDAIAGEGGDGDDEGAEEGEDDVDGTEGEADE